IGISVIWAGISRGGVMRCRKSRASIAAIAAPAMRTLSLTFSFTSSPLCGIFEQRMYKNLLFRTALSGES
ncbi:MAG: hypothetical protein AABX78_00375, partial [Nanoarchaeota archaeon]